MRRTPASVVLVVALGLLGPALAHAEPGPDYARPGFYLGVGGTYAFHWFPGDFDSDAGGPGATTRTDDTGGVHARLGYRPLRWLAAELEYEWLDGFDNKITGGGGKFTMTSHAVTVNGKFLYPGWGRFQPYGLLGVGVSIYDVNDTSGAGNFLDSTSVGFGGRVGAGLDTYLTESWLINLGLEVMFTTTTIDNSNPAGGDLKNLFYVPIQLGLQYRF